MTFWIYAIALLLLALAILLIPLIRGTSGSSGDQRQSQNIQIAREKKQILEQQLERGEIDQAGFDSSYQDLQNALALELEQSQQQDLQPRGKWMAILILVLIPVISISLYLHFGEYRVVENPEIAMARSNSTAPAMSLDEMVVTIKERLRNAPDDAAGWFALGRTLMAKRQFDEAVVAYQRTYDLVGDDAGLLFSLADALGMQQNGNLLGEPEAMIIRGLELAPNYPNGLWLAGMAAEQRKDYVVAHQYWSRLLPMIQDNQKSADEIRTLLAMLEQREPKLLQEPQVATNVAQLTIRVDISPELKQRAKPGDAVFVYAKAMQGPPMPLAVRKLRLQDLPLSLTLSDDDAMMPSMRLSSFDQVVVGARVSFSGNPVAQPGDFFTEVGSVSSAEPPAEISLTIDQVR
jgi:cytochrome c-type biogenesis protein CcmH